MGDGDTIRLLREWHEGDGEALAELIRRNLDWVGAFVQRRLGPLVRAKAETQDIVQEAMIDVLTYGPRFEISDEEQFRGLLARIVENNIRDQNKGLRRLRRDAVREKAVTRDSVLCLDPPARSVTRPSQAASRNEETEWVRLALELLDAKDRGVLWLREWEKLPFAEIGERLGIPHNTARMRFQRALPKLAEKVAQLRLGRGLQPLDGPHGGSTSS